MAGASVSEQTPTLGEFLAMRLASIGIREFFGVPGASFLPRTTLLIGACIVKPTLSWVHRTPRALSRSWAVAQESSVNLACFHPAQATSTWPCWCDHHFKRPSICQLHLDRRP